MPEDTMQKQSPPHASAAKSNMETPVAPTAASIASLAGNWASATARRAKLLSELALAETKLAAISLALMVFLAMLAAAFVLGTWGLLMAGLIYGLLQLQVPLWPMLLLLGGLHALLATLAWRATVALSDNLEFRHTLGQVERAFSRSSLTGLNEGVQQ